MRPIFSATGLLITVTIIMCLTLLPIGCERRSPSMTALTQMPQRHTVVGYERAEFGAGWGSSTTRPGCSVRDDMLRTQLTVLTESDRCKPIAQGICPYSGRVISSDRHGGWGANRAGSHLSPVGSLGHGGICLADGETVGICQRSGQPGGRGQGRKSSQVGFSTIGMVTIG